jgi:hypothetical protein
MNDCGLRIADCGLRIADCGLQYDCYGYAGYAEIGVNLRLVTDKSAIRNLQSSPASHELHNLKPVAGT